MLEDKSPDPGCGWHDGLGTLVEPLKDYAIFLLDPDGRVLTWNSGAERIKGYCANEIIGEHYSRFYTSEDIAQGKPVQALRMATAEGRFQDECWRLRKDGSRFWASVVITAMRNPSGALRGFAKVTRDLTEWRQAENERALLLAREQAAHDRFRLKDEFLSLLAQELRSPLAPILNSLRVARLAGEDAQVRDRALETAERQTLHMSVLLADLVEATALGRGQIQLQREWLDLGSLVRTTVEEKQRALQAGGLHFTVAPIDQQIWICADAGRLRQVLARVLGIAAKYRAGESRIAIGVKVSAETQKAVVTVEADGTAIPQDLLPCLSEPFSQPDQILIRSNGGLALGLTVVKGLVELHGGTVSATTPRPGKGTTFTVRLPLDRKCWVSPAWPAKIAAPAVARRVVIIEDNQDTADSLSLLLGMVGHNVSVANSGPDGVRMATAQKPDVVLSDIGLPGCDGFEVARQLRKLPGFGNALLVALTGYGDDETRRKSREAGFDYHLTKPVDPKALLALLRDAE
jgi:PAS domain S-box-containing protein